MITFYKTMPDACEIGDVGLLKLTKNDYPFCSHLQLFKRKKNNEANGEHLYPSKKALITTSISPDKAEVMSDAIEKGEEEVLIQLKDLGLEVILKEIDNLKSSFQKESLSF